MKHVTIKPGQVDLVGLKITQNDRLGHFKPVKWKEVTCSHQSHSRILRYPRKRGIKSSVWISVAGHV